jgi:hypothetical protein
MTLKRAIMAELANAMPPLSINQYELRRWGQLWLADTNPDTNRAKNTNAFDKQQSVNFARFIDRAFADAVAVIRSKFSKY